VPYQTKIVLHCRSGVPTNLEALVEAFIRDGVKFVGVVGQGSGTVEDLIDSFVVGDGSDPSRFILTSSHPKETLEQAVHFASELTGEYAGSVQVVEV
jgi:hypothetical protein